MTYTLESTVTVHEEDFSEGGVSRGEQVVETEEIAKEGVDSWEDLDTEEEEVSVFPGSDYQTCQPR